MKTFQLLLPFPVLVSSCKVCLLLPSFVLSFFFLELIQNKELMEKKKEQNKQAKPCECLCNSEITVLMLSIKMSELSRPNQI